MNEIENEMKYFHHRNYLFIRLVTFLPTILQSVNCRHFRLSLLLAYPNVAPYSACILATQNIRQECKCLVMANTTVCFLRFNHVKKV
jgi:hypothetical protein